MRKVDSLEAAAQAARAARAARTSSINTIVFSDQNLLLPGRHRSYESKQLHNETLGHRSSPPLGPGRAAESADPALPCLVSPTTVLLRGHCWHCRPRLPDAAPSPERDRVAVANLRHGGQDSQVLRRRDHLG